MPSGPQPCSARPSPQSIPVGCTGPGWQQIAADPSPAATLGSAAPQPAGEVTPATHVHLQGLLLTFPVSISAVIRMAPLGPVAGLFKIF